jgi:predicted glycosyltransferase
MTGVRRDKRVLIYSHDTFGLGHLRRCREIAHALVVAEQNLSVLILSGSPIIGSFDFRARVDFVRVPGVIKLRNGDYTSLALHIDIEQTMAMRASIIEHTAKIYDPDLFLVDKEPLGLRGEVENTLAMLNARGTPCILGLRDVLDEPALLVPEWERKQAAPALMKYYHDIWIYGLPQIYDPLQGVAMVDSVRKKVTYTGYLPRNVPQATPGLTLEKIEEPYLLVTVGGGGDGEQIVDWVLRAYESDPDLPYPALLVLGPFMASELQSDFLQRANRLPNIEAITFEARMESLMDRALGVVCMGGYNTFCEILSFNKRALVVPRTEPRMEQHIRATRAAQLGLVSVLADDSRREAQVMATALRTLPQQPPPSETVVPGLLDGRDNVIKLARQWLRRRRRGLSVASAAANTRAAWRTGR